ncbi:MAG: hypothetical protein IJC86_05370 [Clostridia bacterium]|nr:hypothetical protein [Clostridia bacterium]
MQEVRISDITMKQSVKSADFTLTFKEKLELSKLLDKLGVSVIEIEGIENNKIDGLRIKSIAANVKNGILAVPVKHTRESVEATWNALKEAASPRLQVAAPVSSVQMEYIFGKKPQKVLESIAETISICKEYTDDVEFIADDATRSDEKFLYEAVSTAIKAGAKIITLCDTAGTMLPTEFAAFLDTLYENVPELKNVDLGISCSNELCMADACAIAAVRYGAVEIKTASYSTATASLPNVAKIITAKSSSFKAYCSVRMTELNRAIRQIEWMCETDRSKSSPFDNGVQDGSDKIMLSCHDEMPAVLKMAEDLGYDLSEEDGVKVWEAFEHIAARKEQVSSKELDAIIASAAMQVPPTYKVDNFVVNTGSNTSAMAHMKLIRDDKVYEGVSLGDGCIDAVFLAIEQIIGKHYELDDFQIQSVTQGREAMGQAVVKLRSDGKIYSGKGISTDIVCASVHAYINALNKIVYEEEEE